MRVTMKVISPILVGGRILRPGDKVELGACDAEDLRRRKKVEPIKPAGKRAA